MKKFLILFLVAAQIAVAQNPMSPDEAKVWLINYFSIPPNAEIDKFVTFGDPITSAIINWKTDGGYHSHFRVYDFKKQAVTDQMDLD